MKKKILQSFAVLTIIFMGGFWSVQSSFAESSIERVSVASDGTQGNWTSYWNSISPDGRYVAFSSTASNLVPGDTNGEIDVFVHDRQTGETTRVSVASDGTQGNNYSYAPSISADGRYVAFSSGASNLVSGDTNDKGDVFIHDRQTGETSRISVSSDGTQGNGDSINPPTISADGCYIAFASEASNLVPGDTNGAIDVFVHDRQTGETSRVSVSSDGTQSNGTQGDGGSAQPAMSSNGRYVAFLSNASNFVVGDTNREADVFVHDRQTGETSRVSISSDGTQGNRKSDYPLSISADGRYVAFPSGASNLVSGDTNNAEDVFVHDRQTGGTARVSVASDGAQFHDGYKTAMSSDGRYVAFYSGSYYVESGSYYVEVDVFVHDRQTGETALVSPAIKVGYGNGGGGDLLSMSDDGMHVAFSSCIPNLVSGDTNDAEDVFVAKNPLFDGAPHPQPTHKVAYIPVKFSDGSPFAYSVDQLKQRAKKVEEYYKQQSNGVVNIKSEFIFDNPIILKKSLAQYKIDFPNSEGGLDTNRNLWEAVRKDAIGRATEETKDTTHFNDEDSRYKAVVIIQPECIQSFAEIDANDVFHAGKRIITSEKKSFATWAHELGHSLFQLGDYYYSKEDIGVGLWGLMGSATIMNPTAPLMSYNRIEKNWLSYEQKSYGTYSIDYLSDNDYSGKPIRYDTTKGNQTDYYILEGRNPKDEFENQTLKDDTLKPGTYCSDKSDYYTYKLKQDKGVMLYKVSEKENPTDITKDKINAVSHENNSNIVTLTPGGNSIDEEAQVKFSLEETFGKQRVKIEEYPINNRKIIPLTTSFKTENQSAISEFIPTENQPDIDLHVTSQDGKKVGMNYDTGEYEIQIDGATTSYNIPGGGPEWISIPDNVKASYYVDTTPLKKWSEETGATVTDIEAQWRITTFDGDGNRTDSEEITTPIELDQETAPLAIDASVDASPKPINSKTPGKWINVFVELPEKYDVQQVDKDSILLNQKLKPSKIEVGDYDKDKIKDMTLQFDKQQVLKLFSDPNNKMLVVDGQVNFEGSELPFQGSINVGLNQEIIASFDSLKKLVNSSNINSGIKRVLLHQVAVARIFYERGNIKIMNRTLDRLKRLVNVYSKNLMPKRLRISKDLADKMIVIIQKIKTLQ